MIDSQLKKLQAALLDGRIDRDTYDAMRNDLLQLKSKGTAESTGHNRCEQLVGEAMSRCESNDFEDAIALATDAINLSPKNANAYFVRAVGLWGRQKEKEALGDLAKALHLDPKHVPSLCFKANCRLEAGKFRDAVTLLSKVLKIDPENDEAFYRRAMIYEGWARLTGEEKLGLALSDFEAANQLNSEWEVPNYSATSPKKVDWVEIRGLPEPVVVCADPLTVKAIPYVEPFVNSDQGRLVQFRCGQCGVLQRSLSSELGVKVTCTSCQTINETPADIVKGLWTAASVTGQIALAVGKGVGKAVLESGGQLYRNERHSGSGSSPRTQSSNSGSSGTTSSSSGSTSQSRPNRPAPRTLSTPRALTGCVARRESGRSVSFSHRCDVCGWLNSSTFGVDKGGSGTINGSFMCQKCKEMRQYRIARG